MSSGGWSDEFLRQLAPVTVDNARLAGESVCKRGLPDLRYCMAEHAQHGQCLMIRGHDGPHRSLDSKDSEWP